MDDGSASRPSARAEHVLFTRKQKIRVTRSARKHHIGVAHAIAAMRAAGMPTVVGDALRFVGIDDRGAELEVISVPDDRSGEGLAVIHVMPTRFRGKGNR